MKALIDGDLIVYKAGFGAQSKSTDVPVKNSLHNARTMLKHQIATLRKYFSIDEVYLYLTSDDKSNFRFEVAKTQVYKGNRTQPKPIHYKQIRKYLRDAFKATVVFNEEADDAIGKKSQELKDQCVIVSADKDLRMLPGWHWEMNDRTPFYVSELGQLLLERRTGSRCQLFGTGQCWFYAQLLLGDKADNIPGVKGYGDVKTYHALKDCRHVLDLHATTKRIYKQEGLDEARYQEISELLWIRR